MSMRSATQSGRFASQRGLDWQSQLGSIARKKRDAARDDDWRFSALGLRPTADQELIERAYWYQARKYSAAAAHDRHAARKLAAIEVAYQALRSPINEPWTTRLGPARSSLPRRRRRHENLADFILVVGLLILLVAAALLVLNPSLHVQFDTALQQLTTLLHRAGIARF